MTNKKNNILIINLCDLRDTLHVLEFVRPVELIVEKITSNYKIQHYLEDINYFKFTHIILCGVALKDFEYENHLNKFKWISTYTGKLLGICAGAQIISQVYENTLIKHQEIGLEKVELIKNDTILKNLSFPLEIYGLHNNSFKNYNSFDILLQGKVPQMIKHTKKNHYGCLFHPEVRNHKLIENFINL